MGGTPPGGNVPPPGEGRTGAACSRSGPRVRGRRASDLLAASTLGIGALAPRAAEAGSDPYQACLDHCWGSYQLCVGGTTPVEECDARLDRCEAGCYT